MKNRELSSQLDKLKNLFGKTKDFEAKGIEIDVLSHWAKYLCVLCAGFLENSLVEIFVEFSSRSASPNVASYARTSLSQISNPKTERFFQVTNSFNRSWGDKFTAFTEENGRKEAINAIMTHRHKIAHGQSSDISFYRLSEYFAKSVEVVEFLEDLCK